MRECLGSNHERVIMDVVTNYEREEDSITFYYNF